MIKLLAGSESHKDFPMNLSIYLDSFINRSVYTIMSLNFVPLHAFNYNKLWEIRSR